MTAPLDPVIEEIQSLIKYRRHLNDELHPERMHLEHLLPKSVERMVKARMKSLQKQADKVTDMMLALKEKSTILDEAVKLLTETKGVGDTSALSLLVAMIRTRKNIKQTNKPHRSQESRHSIATAARCEGNEPSLEDAKRSVRLSTWRLS